MRCPPLIGCAPRTSPELVHVHRSVDASSTQLGPAQLSTAPFSSARGHASFRRCLWTCIVPSLLCPLLIGCAPRTSDPSLWTCIVPSMPVHCPTAAPRAPPTRACGRASLRRCIVHRAPLQVSGWPAATEGCVTVRVSRSGLAHGSSYRGDPGVSCAPRTSDPHMWTCIAPSMHGPPSTPAGVRVASRC